MQVISEEKINEIRNASDIVSIISSYIPLKMQGKNYFGVCPFHDDHSPSMSVSKERQLFKCFVCNKGGNVFTFVKDYENISFPEAVKRVADIVGIPFDFNPAPSIPKKYKNEYEIMDFATKVFQNNLNSKEGTLAKEYLSKRSINDEIIKEFRIGLSLNDNTYLYNVLTKKNYDINTLDELGLITKDGLKAYDKFVNRIMIPITNLDGDVVGFTGRIFNNEDSAKYINTKETILYKKGNILFNYYNAKNYIRDSKLAILVEGNMDAIRMYATGVKNVLALMGTAITKEQIEILKKLRVPIILMLDNDSAGELATLNVGNELNKNNIETKVVRLKEAKDPDEYIVKFGIDKFRDAIKHSINYFDYKLNYLKENKNLNNTDELINYVKEVLKILSNEDDLTKEITIKKISEEYNIDYELLKKELEFSKTIASPKKEEVKVTVKKKNNYTKCVEKILYYLMSDSKYLDIYNKYDSYFDNKEERDLLRNIEQYIKKYGKINFADFINYLENYSNFQDLVNNIKESIDFNELTEKEFIEYLEKIKSIQVENKIKMLKNKIRSETDINEQIRLSEELIELKKGSVKNG